MATYKVPQNVEAEDKLIGPLSLRQFIFVILGLGFGYITFFFFAKVHPIAAIPFIFPAGAFMILGVYQRSDQPVEVYLASAIRFHLKPHARIWDQEGYEERVIITAPVRIEKNYTKGYSRDQVSSHLDNLSRLMDTRGWASKLATDWQNPDLEASATSDRLVQPDEISTSQDPRQPIYAQPVDVQDENTSIVARGFDTKIQEAENETHQKAMLALQQARQSTDEPISPVVFTKYPAMHQKTVEPALVSTPQAQSAPTDVAQPALQPQPTTPATAQQQSANITSQSPATTNMPTAQPSPMTDDPEDDTLSSDNEVEIQLH